MRMEVEEKEEEEEVKDGEDEKGSAGRARGGWRGRRVCWRRRRKMVSDGDEGVRGGGRNKRLVIR